VGAFTYNIHHKQPHPHPRPRSPDAATAAAVEQLLFSMENSKLGWLSSIHAVGPGWQQVAKL